MQQPQPIQLPAAAGQRSVRATVPPPPPPRVLLHPPPTGPLSPRTHTKRASPACLHPAETTKNASVETLVQSAGMAQACQLDRLHATCVCAIARKLVTKGDKGKSTNINTALHSARQLRQCDQSMLLQIIAVLAASAPAGSVDLQGKARPDLLQAAASQILPKPVSPRHGRLIDAALPLFVYVAARHAGAPLVRMVLHGQVPPTDPVLAGGCLQQVQRARATGHAASI